MAHWRLRLDEVARAFLDLEWDECLESGIPTCSRCSLACNSSDAASLYRCTDCIVGTLHCRTCTQLSHSAYPLHRFQVRPFLCALKIRSNFLIRV